MIIEIYSAVIKNRKRLEEHARHKYPDADVIQTCKDCVSVDVIQKAKQQGLAFLSDAWTDEERFVLKPDDVLKRYNVSDEALVNNPYLFEDLGAVFSDMSDDSYILEVFV